MAFDSSQLPLGKATVYPDCYDAAVLVAVPRTATRDFWPTDAALPFVGTDEWTGYELSWLNRKGKPQVACIRLHYSALSPAIVESKSLKLYLNSFNQSRFHSDEDVVSTIRRDLLAVVGADIKVQLLSVHAAAELAISDWQAPCLDGLDIGIEHYEPDARLLHCSHGDRIEESVCTHLFRSNCPVTSQPDWASVRIHYRGKPIQPESLLRYLCSYRQHQGFHEQCMERIFCDIWQHCRPELLSVEGRFTRRGGLDINPFRSSDAALHPIGARLVRQ